MAFGVALLLWGSTCWSGKVHSELGTDGTRNLRGEPLPFLSADELPD